MQTILGTLPEDINITKAIVDSDLDGVVCASLLKSIFGDIEVLLVEPNQVQQGFLDKDVDSKTVIADLGYVKGCGLYFDHHKNTEPKEEIIGRWASAPSCAGIIFEAYKTKFDLNKYLELVKFVDSFDSGNITKSQVENPDFFMNLGFAITRTDKAFGKIIVEELFKMQSIEDLKKIQVITEKINEFIKQRDEYFEYLKTNVEIINNVAFVDNRNFDSDITHSYLVNVVYPNTDVVVRIKGDGNELGKIHLSISRNNFNEKVKEHNFLPIVTELNPKISGGHRYASGASLPEGLSLDEAKKIILNMLLKY
jgi:hypothetical protein